MQSVVNVESAVKEFLVASALWFRDPAELRGDTHLLELRVLDSLNVISLVDFVEETYEIELEPAEIQQFTTIDNIARVIRSKVGS